MPLEPLAEGSDRWVTIIETLATKIADTTLSFHKYLVNVLGMPAPKVFTHFGLAAGVPNYDPPLDQCPAVVLQTVNTDPVNDRGSGSERWTFSVLLYFKMEMRDGDQRKPIRANHELIRTLLYGWRGPGPTDPLGVIPGVGKYEIVGDISPQLGIPAVGYTVARTMFTLRFDVFETILG